MSRFQFNVTSSAALAASTNFAYLMAASGGGFKLRRMTLGVVTNTATVPTSQQVVVAVYRVTAMTSPGGAPTVNQLDPNSNANTATPYTTGTPTLGSAASWPIPFNTQSGVDLPWELLEEWVCTKGIANGFAWQNTTNALPSGHQLVLSVEWEE